MNEEFDFGSLKGKKQEDKQEIKKEILDITKKQIATREFYEGDWRYDNYQYQEKCYICHKIRLCSSGSACCPVCDGFMIEKEYQDFENKYKEKDITNAFGTAELPKDNKIDVAFTDNQMPEIKKPQPKIVQNLPDTEEFPLEIVKQETPIANLPSKQEVDAYLKMYNYIKKTVVDESDFMWIGNKKFMKKSGWRKFIKAFNISIQLLEKNVFELEGDIHAEVRVRASLPNGQFVEGFAVKSKSEYYSEKYKSYGNYNIHNLIATAYTRATNRAISDLVGFGEVSAEEVQTSGGDIEDAFGGGK